MANPTVPREIDLPVIRGLAWPHQDLGTITVYDSSGVVVDITNTTLAGSIRVADSLDSTQVAAITIAKTDPTDGVFTFTVNAATTAALTLGRTYFFHIRATGAWTDNVAKIVLQGKVFATA